MDRHSRRRARTDLGQAEHIAPKSSLEISRAGLDKRLIALLLLCLILLLPSLSFASPTVTSIRWTNQQDKLRIVFDLTEIPTIEISSSESFFKVTMQNTKMADDVTNVQEITDEVVSYVAADYWQDALNIGIFLRYPIKTSFFILTNPNRLVVDIGKEFTRISNYQNYARGLDFVEIERGSTRGVAEAHALIIDPKYFELRPALAADELGANVIQSVGTLLGSVLSGSETNKIGFSRNKVSRIVKRERAIAGMNGTYFAPDGRPLGILMIDKNLVSLPILDRTALAITKNNRYFIDSFLSDNYIMLGDESNGSAKRFELNWYNEARGDNGIAIYSSVYGPSTGTDNSGLELTIEDGEITKIQPGNSVIPDDGFVVSATGAPIAVLTDLAQEGTPITINLNLLAFSMPNLGNDEVVHLIAGGPRLLKDGQPYVTKQSESFQRDVSQNRAARSAVGITQDNKLILITIDGPQRKRRLRSITGTEKSLGMTLEELSDLLLYLGATEAVNLDGGSSSTLVLNNQILNSPVLGGEAKVSNALLVFPRKLK